MSDSLAVKLYLPIPHKLLSPNVKSHWAAKAKVIKAARAAAKREAGRALDGRTPPLWGKASVTAVLFTTSAGRPRDPDNFIASLKPYFDGIADAGLVGNDRNLWPDRPRFEKCLTMPRVELTVTPE